MPSAWTFPGQGSQSAGMGRQLLQDYPRARMVLRMAEDMSGLPLEQLRHRGSDRDLMQPSVAEPLITAISIGYADLLYSLGIRPDVVAGYSAGEVAAFYAAGIFDLETALKVAVFRGQLFDEFTSDHHRMITCTGVTEESVQQVVHDMATHSKPIYLAANNAPQHFTLVGDEVFMLEAEANLLRLGGSIGQVDVAGMWHTNHLDRASDRLFDFLTSIEFFPPLTTTVTSLSGRPRLDVQALQHDLAYGVCQCVQWRSVISELTRAGANSFIECGAGRVLFGLMRWNKEDSNSYESICVEDRSGGMRPFKKYAIQLIDKGRE